MIQKIFGTIFIAAALAACNNHPAASGSQLRIVATTTIIGDIARNVAGDKAIVVTLLTPGVDPHEYEPVPSDLQTISQAPIVFANGAGLEPWLTKFAASAGTTSNVRYVVDGLATQTLPGSATIDPHLWFDVNNASHYAEQIRDGLIAVDPGNPYHAFVSFSGYNAYTPTTPGHVFDVTYDPASGTATWKAQTPFLLQQAGSQARCETLDGLEYAAAQRVGRILGGGGQLHGGVVARRFNQCALHDLAPQDQGHQPLAVPPQCRGGTLQPRVQGFRRGWLARQVGERTIR